MKHIHFSYSTALDGTQLNALSDEAIQAQHILQTASGQGNDFLGWLDLPTRIEKELTDITQTVNTLAQKSEVIVCIGIGGSYLGAKATIEAMQPFFQPAKPKIVFAGHNISEDYLFELQQYLKDKTFSIICISKSGTTTEPAIAFRILKKQLEMQCGEESKQRIVCITDAHKGALKTLADEQGYKTFVIDDNVGGRFSVLSPVGLLPIACAGIDLTALLEGAKYMQTYCQQTDVQKNEALQYAIARNCLYRAGKKIEILVNFNPKLQYIAEWWKQLYGESEGKEHKGLFPASVNFTTDLHSMGQYIQDGERHLMETFITVEETSHLLTIPQETNNLDQLNFLAGKRLNFVNQMAEKGTVLAHIDGGVPILQIIMPTISEYYLGELFYFFEYACAVSGYMLHVNPFNQPGVEAYKKNMFALLNKPGYEKEAEAIQKRIK